VLRPALHLWLAWGSIPHISKPSLDQDNHSGSNRKGRENRIFKIAFPAYMPQPSNLDERLIPHLLYLNGEGIDHDKLQSALNEVLNHPLGSAYCWIVLLPEREVLPFSDKISFLLPGDGNNELLLRRLDETQILHVTGDGLGLSDWLKKNGC